MWLPGAKVMWVGFFFLVWGHFALNKCFDHMWWSDVLCRYIGQMWMPSAVAR